MRYASHQKADNIILTIIAVNLVLFIATLVINGDRELIGILGLTPAQWTSEPWTILTSIFMHADVLHILFNMLALFFLGRFLCMMIGDKWFLTIFFAGGIMGSFFFIMFSTFLDTGWVTVIGASGAVFAIGGALAILAPQMKVIIFPIPAPMPLWAAIVIMFVILTLPAVASDRINIAWEAHLGGILTGAAIGYYLRRRGLRRIVL